ncbi:ABC transporter substrate-binding protein [Chitiniphilus purpureus]|uniref:ABC transporter substrate-binding protein n=1 Tax=Chitiniphilus purpureus TaxID=2981137 RepID=A0ABY6DHV8_9NEIS|nr:ABC transporter substrate-binding protein [Chitiniphilus sp. CD1]UXY13906.1 ABC transporter substrate-binding protein [Chitiniphilus sp. CD1]
MKPPGRIACLSSETVHVLYALGEQHRIVGVSAFARHPAGVTGRHPVICGFQSGKPDKILAVRPELVLAYSSLQGDLVKACVEAGLPVHLFNQHDLAGIFGMIATLGRLLDCTGRADALIAALQARLDAARPVAGGPRPRVYFEEWHSPLTTGIRWVSELIGIAGGEDVFAAQSHAVRFAGRQVDAAAVIAAAPQLIVGSWCGQPFDAARVMARHGWDVVPAVRQARVHSIASHDILVPGIAAITHGLPQLQTLIRSIHP